MVNSMDIYSKLHFEIKHGIGPYINNVTNGNGNLRDTEPHFTEYCISIQNFRNNSPHSSSDRHQHIKKKPKLFMQCFSYCLPTTTKDFWHLL